MLIIFLRNWVWGTPFPSPDSLLCLSISLSNLNHHLPTSTPGLSHSLHSFFSTHHLHFSLTFLGFASLLFQTSFFCSFFSWASRCWEISSIESLCTSLFLSLTSIILCYEIILTYYSLLLIKKSYVMKFYLSSFIIIADSFLGMHTLGSNAIKLSRKIG